MCVPGPAIPFIGSTSCGPSHGREGKRGKANASRVGQHASVVMTRRQFRANRGERIEQQDNNIRQSEIR